MATTAGKSASAVKELVFAWEGKDKAGKVVKGELRAGSETIVNVTLRRQGILVTKVKKKAFKTGKNDVPVLDKEV
jgi:type IV pilus assembly protein PilC